MLKMGDKLLQRDQRTEIGLALSFMILTLVVYGQTVGFGFLHFDDNVYVTDNIQVRSGLTVDSLRWAFTTLEAGFWHPLTWISLMLDAQLYGSWAGGFHLTNVLLHGLATLILFITLSRVTGECWRSAFVAGVFALHPLHVESVAWVAERKDVLSGFFWMTVMASYAWYAARPGPGRYGLLLTFFVLGLMAKPMLVTLPFVLLLLDVWPLDRVLEGRDGTERGRFRRASLSMLILEKIPLLFLSTGFSILTYWSEHQAGALTAGASYPLEARVINALVSYAVYLEKMLWPAGLAAFYPHPGIWPGHSVFLSGLVLAGISGAVVLLARRRPYLGVGWLWYLGTLVPVIGIVQIGNIAMADRFTYLPLLGPAIMMAWGIPHLFERMGGGWSRRTAWVTGTAFLVVCAILSWQQVRYWNDTETLFLRALAVTGGNYKAHHGLGMALLEQGRFAEAEVHLRQSLGLRDDDRARNDLGVIQMSQGRFADAEEQFRKASVLNPSVARYWNNHGAALGLQGRTAEAVPLFRRALQIAPAYDEARRNLEQARDRQGPEGG
jgi:tetratricopeptide (TPR) repeat protein